MLNVTWTVDREGKLTARWNMIPDIRKIIGPTDRKAARVFLRGVGLRLSGGRRS